MKDSLWRKAFHARFSDFCYSSKTKCIVPRPLNPKPQAPEGIGVRFDSGCRISSASVYNTHYGMGIAVSPGSGCMPRCQTEYSLRELQLCMNVCDILRVLLGVSESIHNLPTTDIVLKWGAFSFLCVISLATPPSRHPCARILKPKSCRRPQTP